VNSRTSQRFRSSFERLPPKVQARARAAYRLFREFPFHPSLRLKQVHPTLPIYSVRVGVSYRALGVREGDDLVWFWIGSHSDYDHLVKQLGR